MNLMAAALQVRVKSYVFVLLQFSILAVLIFYPFKPNSSLTAAVLAGKIIELTAIVGILLAAITIRSSLTILPQPKQNAALGTSGLYKYVRHPMYSLVILFAIGSTVEDLAPAKFFLTAVLVLVLYLKSRFEERLLIEKFSGYAKYAQQVPRFVPFLIRRNIG